MATIYGEKWKTVSSLGEGGQAHTFRARLVRNPKKDVVLKRLKNTTRLGRFKDEAEALKRLNHPRIPKLVDLNVEDDPYYVVYELVEGETLKKLVEAGEIDFDKGIDLVRDIVEAANAAHAANIVHRDIKPDNVIVDSGKRAHLIDFGLCQHGDGGFHNTVTGEGIGSWGFAAPEAAAGSREETGPWSDVYSLGKLMYYAVSNGGMINREDVGGAMRTDFPNRLDVRRSYLENWLNLTVTDQRFERISTANLQEKIEKETQLMRAGVNRIGARDQVCPICHQGHLNPVLDPHQKSLMGFKQYAAKTEHRVMRCTYCGWVQGHWINDTDGFEEWEF